MRLITIPFSHYAEKARWALDHAKLPYQEEAHLPGFHLAATKRAGGKTVPILVTSEGTFTDSTDILAFVDAKAPEDRKIWPRDPEARQKAQALEDDFDRGLGKASRVLAYHYLLPEPDKLMAAIGARLSRAERWIFRAGLPLLSRLIRKQYRVNDENARRSLTAVHEAFDTAERALAEGGRYLVGDKITGADIAFAALSAPVLCPPGHPAYDVALHQLPLSMQPEVKRLRARPAGQHVLSLYAKNR